MLPDAWLARDHSLELLWRDKSSQYLSWNEGADALAVTYKPCTALPPCELHTFL